MNTDLPAFLRRAASERFSHADSWDCAMTLANWVWAVTGSDPAPDLRGAYRTTLGWRRIVEREGGLVSLVGRLAEKAGFRRTDDPLPGDIGVIEVPTVGPAGAIRTQRGWALKLNDGLTMVDVPALAAWRVE